MVQRDGAACCAILAGTAGTLERGRCAPSRRRAGAARYNGHEAQDPYRPHLGSVWGRPSPLLKLGLHFDGLGSSVKCIRCIRSRMCVDTGDELRQGAPFSNRCATAATDAGDPHRPLDLPSDPRHSPLIIPNFTSRYLESMSGCQVKVP